MKRLAIIFLVGALGAGALMGYQRYQQDWRFRKQVREATAGVQEWWDDLLAPMEPDTSIMDQRHEERLRAFGRSASRANQMLIQQHQGPQGVDRDEVGNPGSWGDLDLNEDGGGIYESE